MKGTFRRITDSRLAAPWKRRHSSAIRDTGFDPYRERGALPEPSVCSGCSAVFRGGRWTWAAAPAEANRVTCPACRRVNDRYPAGFLTVGGEFLADHLDEIKNLIHNRADAEREAHPLNRIATWEEENGEIHITTTDTHTPRRIGQALRDAYEGDLAVDYAEDYSIIRVQWAR